MKNLKLLGSVSPSSSLSRSRSSSQLLPYSVQEFGATIPYSREYPIPILIKKKVLFQFIKFNFQISDAKILRAMLAHDQYAALASVLGWFWRTPRTALAPSCIGAKDPRKMTTLPLPPLQISWLGACRR